ncbi:MAG: HAD family hydrolase [Bacilli bacterium]
MIKLIATDLDGTLFYPKRRFTLLTKKNMKLLKDFSAAGGKIVLVTGRSRRVASKVGKKLNINISVLGCNGAFFYEDNEYKYDKPIDQQLFMKVYMKMRKNFGIIGWLLLDDTDIMKVSTPVVSNVIILIARLLNRFNFAYREKYLIGEKPFLDAVSSGKCYKLMPVFGMGKGGREKAKSAAIALEDLFGDQLDITIADVSLEITKKGTNKGNALRDYIKEKGISEDEVLVIGDADNDISMLSNFKHSFAMNSGEKEAKRVAKYHIDYVSDIRDCVLDENGKLKEFSEPKKI